MRVILLFFLLFLPLFSNYDKQLGIAQKDTSGHIPKNLQNLKLTTLQYDKLKIILQQHRSKLLELHQEEEKLETMLKELFKSEKFDQDTFLSKKEKLKLKMATIETDFFLKLHKLFNSKQRELFSQYIEEWEIE